MEVRVARLSIDAADNEVLRSQIQLLTNQSELQIQELRSQTQARIEAHQAEVLIHEENA